MQWLDEAPTDTGTGSVQRIQVLAGALLQFAPIAFVCGAIAILVLASPNAHRAPDARATATSTPERAAASSSGLASVDVAATRTALEAAATPTPMPSPSLTATSSPTPLSTTEPAVATATPVTEPATPTPSATPSPTPRPARPTPTPATANPFLKLIEPLIVHAQAERRKAQAEDPEYARRIDTALNQDRINFLAMGHGITYEPPWPPDRIGSISIFSLNLKTGRFDQITINHDVRAPEVERHLATTNKGDAGKAHKIDRALFAGGHPLLQRTVENATGLRIDYLVTFGDVILKNLVDTLDGVSVVSPYPFQTNPCFVVAGKQIPGLAIAAQKQALTGEQAVCFLKGIEIVGGEQRYTKSRENAHRIPVLKRAISQRLNERLFQDPLLAVKLAMLLRESFERKEIQTNLDLLGMVPALLGKITPSDIANGFSVPPTNATVYLVDQHSGDGGFLWIVNDTNEVTRKDIAAGVYTRGERFDATFAVAMRGDPYAPNLPESYWHRAREVVRLKLR